MPASQKPKPETFETALARIEQIAAQMESGDLPLEDLVVVYEEGLRLVGFCSARLEEAEKRLQTITRNAAGQPQGIAPIKSPEEIPSSTPRETSASEDDSGGSEPARLF